MTQSETPPPQRQSHPTSSNLRHSSGMPWILQPDATKLPAPITRPIALQHSRAAYKAQPLSLPAPPHPFSSSLCPFFFSVLFFFYSNTEGGTSREPANTRKSVLGTCTCTCTRTGNLEVLVAHDNIDVLVLVPASMIDSEITDQK